MRNRGKKQEISIKGQVHLRRKAWQTRNRPKGFHDMQEEQNAAQKEKIQCQTHQEKAWPGEGQLWGKKGGLKDTQGGGGHKAEVGRKSCSTVL